MRKLETGSFGKSVRGGTAVPRARSTQGGTRAPRAFLAVDSEGRAAVENFRLRQSSAGLW
jgi:hypothetical protein